MPSKKRSQNLKEDLSQAGNDNADDGAETGSAPPAHDGRKSVPRPEGNWLGAGVRGIGSLWLGVVLLVVLLVAMACATVFESSHGAEQALALFYRSWWFETLLALLALNIATALVLRFPFSRSQIGFVVTHISILVILAGALVTDWFGVNGEVTVAEGETVEELSINQESVLFSRRSDGARSAIVLDRLPSDGLRAVERPDASALTLDETGIEVVRYVPDSQESEEVVNDNPQPRLAVELSLTVPREAGEGASAWVFADEDATVAGIPVLLRQVDQEELDRLSAAETSEPDASIGSIVVEYEGSTYRFSVEECQKQAVAIGDTGYTLRVLRYMPHAVVGRDNALENASDRPVNPTIEVELVGSKGPLTRPAFAKFPEFWSMHSSAAGPGPTVKFIATANADLDTPISVLRSPNGKVYARFAPEGQPPVVEELPPGASIQSPWEGVRLTMLRQLDHARRSRSVVPVNPIRKNRIPAVELRATAPAGTQTLWLRKYTRSAIMIGDSIYDVVYANRQLPLGFSVTLEDFEIGHYPGTMRPRSFTSRITLVDPVSGRQMHRQVSMNHPTQFGGYTLYQSSYREDGEKMVSVLSAARDPGQFIVFLGYVGTLAGMLLVLGRRVLNQRGRHSGFPTPGDPEAARP